MRELKSLLKDVRLLCRVLFRYKGKPLELYSYQVPIIERLLFLDKKRVICIANTRAGKSLAVAIGIILCALFNPNKRIIQLAPTYSQARIISGYVAEHLGDHAFIRNSVDMEIDMRDIDRLRREVSRNKITFKNRTSIQILSAEGAGERLFGFGGDVIVTDESELIKDEVFNTKIMRMLGDNPDSVLFEIGNPLRKNHFYEHFKSAEYTRMHINWRQCVAEGRLTQEFIDEQRGLLTPLEFGILYDAEFQEDTEDTLIAWKHIQAAMKRDIALEGNVRTIIGVDVARFGADLTVLFIIRTDGIRYEAVDCKFFGKKPTTFTAGEIIRLDEKHHADEIRIDDAGIGGAVTDMLKANEHTKHRTYPFLAGSTSSMTEEDRKRFLNLKSKSYDHLRRLFEKGLIKIEEIGRLPEQLNALRFEFTGSQKMKISDSGEDETAVARKSPDFADALNIACFEMPKSRSAVLSGY